jgi:hypothetical protein
MPRLGGSEPLQIQTERRARRSFWDQPVSRISAEGAFLCHLIGGAKQFQPISRLLAIHKKPPLPIVTGRSVLNKAGNDLARE